jgi:hypothetical protein
MADEIRLSLKFPDEVEVLGKCGLGVPHRLQALRRDWSVYNGPNKGMNRTPKPSYVNYARNARLPNGREAPLATESP